MKIAVLVAISVAKNNFIFSNMLGNFVLLSHLEPVNLNDVYIRILQYNEIHSKLFNYYICELMNLYAIKLMVASYRRISIHSVFIKNTEQQNELPIYPELHQCAGSKAVSITEEAGHCPGPLKLSHYCGYRGGLKQRPYLLRSAMF